jgi:hypothetical protein
MAVSMLRIEQHFSNNIQRCWSYLFFFFFEIFEDTGTSKAPMTLHLLGQASFESRLGCWDVF